MAQSTKTYRAYGQEQLKEVQKLLRQLPEKETRKTRQEAATFLKEDFHKALNKGYSPKELAAYLRKNNQPISMQLIEDAVKQETTTSPIVTPKRKTKETIIVAEQGEQYSRVGHSMIGKSAKQVKEAEEDFGIIPDKPDGEL